MKTIVLVSLLLAARAHATLAIRGVQWPADDVIKVAVSSNGGEPTEIEVPLHSGADQSRTSGLFTATVRQLPAASANERSLILVTLSQQGAELASLYVLRQTADGQYEYANKRPVHGPAASVKGDLTQITKGLRAFRGCTEIGALEALVRYQALWPDHQLAQFSLEVEKDNLDPGTNGQCATPKGPRPAPTVSAPAKPAAPAAPTAPARRAPRPAARRPTPADPYYGNGGYGYPSRGGYGEYGGYGNYGGASGGYPGYGSGGYGDSYGGGGYGSGY